MASIPLATDKLYHFNVIYNHAKSPLSQTNDTILSEAITRWIVESLENMGLVNSYYHDRDKRGNLALGVELARVLSQSEMTILILTPGFVKNCLHQYAQIGAFRNLVDCTPERLVALHYGRAQNQCPAFLSGLEILCFQENWQTDIFLWSRLYSRVASILALSSYDPKTNLFTNECSGCAAEDDFTNGYDVNFRTSVSDTDYCQTFMPSAQNLHDEQYEIKCLNTDLQYTLNHMDKHKLWSSLDLSFRHTDMYGYGSWKSSEGNETNCGDTSELCDESLSLTRVGSEDSLIGEESEGQNNEDVHSQNCPWQSESSLHELLDGTRYIDPTSTRSKYQKEYERLLYLDDLPIRSCDSPFSERDSIKSDSESLERSFSVSDQGEAETDWELGKTEDEIKLRDEREILQTLVGTTLLKELDAVDPDYGWQNHFESKLSETLCKDNRNKTLQTTYDQIPYQFVHTHDTKHFSTLKGCLTPRREMNGPNSSNRQHHKNPGLVNGHPRNVLVDSMTKTPLAFGEDAQNGVRKTRDGHCQKTTVHENELERPINLILQDNSVVRTHSCPPFASLQNLSSPLLHSVERPFHLSNGDEIYCNTSHHLDLAPNSHNLYNTRKSKDERYSEKPAVTYLELYRTNEGVSHFGRDTHLTIPDCDTSVHVSNRLHGYNEHYSKTVYHKQETKALRKDSDFEDNVPSFVQKDCASEKDITLVGSLVNRFCKSTDTIVAKKRSHSNNHKTDLIGLGYQDQFVNQSTVERHTHHKFHKSPLNCLPNEKCDDTIEFYTTSETTPSYLSLHTYNQVADDPKLNKLYNTHDLLQRFHHKRDGDKINIGKSFNEDKEEVGFTPMTNSVNVSEIHNISQNMKRKNVFGVNVPEKDQSLSCATQDKKVYLSTQNPTDEFTGSDQTYSTETISRCPQMSQGVKESEKSDVHRNDSKGPRESSSLLYNAMNTRNLTVSTQKDYKMQRTDEQSDTTCDCKDTLLANKENMAAPCENIILIDKLDSYTKALPKELSPGNRGVYTNDNRHGTSSKNDGLKYRFHVMENNLNHLSNDINVVADIIASELGQIQVIGNCNTRRSSLLEQETKSENKNYSLLHLNTPSKEGLLINNQAMPKENNELTDSTRGFCKSTSGNDVQHIKRIIDTPVMLTANENQPPIAVHVDMNTERQPDRGEEKIVSIRAYQHEASPTNSQRINRTEIDAQVTTASKDVSGRMRSKRGEERKTIEYDVPNLTGDDTTCTGNSILKSEDKQVSILENSHQFNEKELRQLQTVTMEESQRPYEQNISVEESLQSHQREDTEQTNVNRDSQHAYLSRDTYQKNKAGKDHQNSFENEKGRDETLHNFDRKEEKISPNENISHNASPKNGKNIKIVKMQKSILANNTSEDPACKDKQQIEHTDHGEKLAINGTQHINEDTSNNTQHINEHICVNLQYIQMYPKNDAKYVELTTDDPQDKEEDTSKDTQRSTAHYTQHLEEHLSNIIQDEGEHMHEDTQHKKTNKANDTHNKEEHQSNDTQGKEKHKSNDTQCTEKHTTHDTQHTDEHNRLDTHRTGANSEDARDIEEHTRDNTQDIGKGAYNDAKNVVKHSNNDTQDVVKHASNDSQDVVKDTSKDTQDVREHKSNDKQDVLKHASNDSQDVVKDNDTQDVVEHTSNGTPDAVRHKSNDALEVAGHTSNDLRTTSYEEITQLKCSPTEHMAFKSNEEEDKSCPPRSSTNLVTDIKETTIFETKDKHNSTNDSDLFVNDRIVSVEFLDNFVLEATKQRSFQEVRTPNVVACHLAESIRNDILNCPQAGDLGMLTNDGTHDGAMLLNGRTSGCTMGTNEDTTGDAVVTSEGTVDGTMVTSDGKITVTVLNNDGTGDEAIETGDDAGNDEVETPLKNAKDGGTMLYHDMTLPTDDGTMDVKMLPNDGKGNGIVVPNGGKQDVGKVSDKGQNDKTTITNDGTDDFMMAHDEVCVKAEKVIMQHKITRQLESAITLKYNTTSIANQETANFIDLSPRMFDKETQTRKSTTNVSLMRQNDVQYIEIYTNNEMDLLKSSHILTSGSRQAKTDAEEWLPEKNISESTCDVTSNPCRCHKGNSEVFPMTDEYYVSQMTSGEAATSCGQNIVCCPTKSKRGINNPVENEVTKSEPIMTVGSKSDFDSEFKQSIISPVSSPEANGDLERQLEMQSHFMKKINLKSRCPSDLKSQKSPLQKAQTTDDICSDSAYNQKSGSNTHAKVDEALYQIGNAAAQTTQEKQLAEWTEAQITRKRRRGTNVDGLPSSSSSSSSSSEEEPSDWATTCYKGLCHGLSKPELPFLG